MITFLALVAVYFIGCWGLQWWTKGEVHIPLMMFWPIVVVFAAIMYVFLWPSSLFKGDD